MASRAHLRAQQLVGFVDGSLPYATKPPSTRTVTGRVLWFTLPAEMLAELKTIANKLGTTPFAVYLAVFTLSLWRLERADRLVVGVPHSTRGPADEHTVGCFINTLPVCVESALADTHADFVRRIQAELLTAMQFADVQLQDLAEHLPRRHQDQPVVQALFVLNEPLPVLDFGAVQGHPVPVHLKLAKFDLTVEVVDGDLPRLRVEFRTDVFDDARVGEIVDGFTAIASNFRDSADQPLVNVLPSKPTRVTGEDLVVQPLEAYLPADGKWVALRSQTVSLTATELNRAAARLAARLAESGLGVESRVGLYLNSSIAAWVAVLAILRIGAAYVPLDRSYPASRLEAMAKRAELAIVIHDSEAIPPREWGEGLNLDVDLVESLPPLLNQGPVPDSALAYVMFTSGSTGEPKGVAVQRSVLANLTSWHQRYSYGHARTLQLSPLSFDISIHEALAAWATKSELIVAPEEARRDPFVLAEILEKFEIGRLMISASALAQLAEAAVKADWCFPRLRVVCSGAEQLRITPAIRDFFARHEDLVLQNHYGPSETHVAIGASYPQDPSVWPGWPDVGFPVGNSSVEFAPVRGKSVEKQLLLGGACVARGYLSDPRQTAARFRPDAGSGRGARVYESGDLGQLQSDGTVLYLGRADAQLKIRGFRVEPGEIEAILSQIPSVKNAVVGGSPTDAPDTLVAVVQLASEAAEISTRDLREYLERVLPRYLVPTQYLLVSSMPTTASGKVDRQLVLAKALEGDVAARQRPVQPPHNSDDETAIRAIWSQELGRDVALDDNFFDLGGQSLIAVRIVSRVREAFGVSIRVREIFDNPVFSDFAELALAANPSSASS